MIFVCPPDTSLLVNLNEERKLFMQFIIDKKHWLHVYKLALTANKINKKSHNNPINVYLCRQEDSIKHRLNANLEYCL